METDLPVVQQSPAVKSGFYIRRLFTWNRGCGSEGVDSCGEHHPFCDQGRKK
jgi:hypothetical protein